MTSITVSPNPAPVSAELSLTIEFKTDRLIKHGKWDIKFMVDCAARRHILPLGEIQPQEYQIDTLHQMEFKTSSIDFSNVSRSDLLNIGLLQACLYDIDEGEAIIELNLVTQISKDEETSQLRRTIYHPLE